MDGKLGFKIYFIICYYKIDYAKKKPTNHKEK